MGNRAFSAIKADTSINVSNKDISAANTDVQSTEANTKPEEKKLSPCCVCKETKRERDSCIMENGEENCTSLIEAHKECMRKMGFNI